MDRRPIGQQTSDGLRARLRPEYKDWSEGFVDDGTCENCQTILKG